MLIQFIQSWVSFFLDMDNMGVKRLLTSKLRSAKSANQLFGVMLFHNVLTQCYLLLGCEAALGTFVFGDDFMCKVKMFLQLECFNPSIKELPLRRLVENIGSLIAF